MDPTEFEGSVERKGDALGAGVLEDLLSAKVVTIDLSKDQEELEESVKTLEDFIVKLENFSIKSLCQMMCNQMTEIAADKEEYQIKRKKLAQCIKHFVATHVRGSTAVEGSESNPLIKDATDLISTFKVEFDRLADLFRLTEASLLASYSSLKDIEDPKTVANDCLQRLIATQEVFDRVEEEVNNTNERLVSGELTSNTRASETDLQGLLGVGTGTKKALQDVKRLEKEKEDMREMYISEMDGLKSKYEVEVSRREQNLQNAVEQQKLDLHTSYERVLTEKDVEIASLLKSLDDRDCKFIELEERTKQFEVEVSKRRGLEERLRSLMTDISDLQEANQDLTASGDQLKSQTNSLEELLEQSHQTLQKQRERYDCLLQEEVAKVRQAEQLLLTRPSVNVSVLVEKMGAAHELEVFLQKKACADSDDGSGGSSDSSGGSDGSSGSTGGSGSCGGSSDPSSSAPMMWVDVEVFLVECYRRLHADLISIKMRDSASTALVTSLQVQQADTTSQLREKSELITLLENELLRVHSDRGDYLPSSGRKASTTAQPSVNTARLFNNTKPYFPNFSLGLGKDKIDRKLDMERALDVDDAEQDLDLEAMSNINHHSNTDHDADSVIQAVHLQRNRFMKLSMEKESELIRLRQQIERLEEERAESKEENLELFRRLRTLRLSSSSTSTVSFDENTSVWDRQHGASTSSSQLRGRSGDRKDRALDEKYLHLHEKGLSPFNLEVYDKNKALSRLNPFEKALLVLSKTMLQDNVTRHVLLVYMLLLHLFALAYLVKVLNPELSSEVEAHYKEQWSQQTFEVLEHLDV